jgi:hypothetical protein
VRLSEAPSFGKSILEYDPNGTGARAYRALAKEFIRRHKSPAGAEDDVRKESAVTDQAIPFPKDHSEL